MFHNFFREIPCLPVVLLLHSSKPWLPGDCGPPWPSSGSVSRGSAFVAVYRPSRESKRPIRWVPRGRAYLSAAKKLIDTSQSAYKAVTDIRGLASQFWRSLSLPYPEPGIRLIRQDDIALFDVQLTTMQAELAEAVESLNEHFDELKSAARERLGRLFNRADYPESLIGLFRIEHDYPSVEPPQYLRELSPELFRQEQARVSETTLFDSLAVSRKAQLALPRTSK